MSLASAIPMPPRRCGRPRPRSGARAADAMTDGGSLLSAAAPLDADDIGALFAGWNKYPHIALAVSGGADSVSLMVLAHRWLAGRASAPRITILTVDHALRPEAAGEAVWVK